MSFANNIHIHIRSSEKLFATLCNIQYSISGELPNYAAPQALSTAIVSESPMSQSGWLGLGLSRGCSGRLLGMGSSPPVEGEPILGVRRRGILAPRTLLLHHGGFVFMNLRGGLL